jgi:hypothetical protein
MAVVCEHLAHRAPNTVVGVLIETLQHPHNFAMIENRRSIAKHMYRPATYRSIGVGGHLQNPLPDFRNFGFQFARAERVECFAALPRVRTMSEFKPVRDIALASSHGQQVWLFRDRGGTIGPSASQPKATPENTVFGPRVADSAKSLPLWPPPRRRGVRDSLNEPVKQTAQVLHESLARILSVWFDRGYLLREILK